MIEFIGRSEDIRQVSDFVLSNKSVLCIEGDGGIGKTRLLNQIGVVLSKLPNLYVCETIDFDNPQMHVVDNIYRIIALEITNNLSNEYFDDFWGVVEHRSFLEKHHASPDQYIAQNRIAQQEFINALVKASSVRKLIFRFDATDNLKKNTSPLEFIAWLSSKVDNLSILVAGRDSSKVLDFLDTGTAKNSQKISISPLSKEECGQYLEAKLKQRQISMNDELRGNLIYYSRGRIILLDMAVEWLLKSTTPDWLLSSDFQGQDHNEEFESNLFFQVRSLREDTDRVLLVLSKIYPLDAEGIKELLALSDDRLNLLFLNLEKYTFIKRIPGGYIKLHDEAERLINLYVWPFLPKKRFEYTIKGAVSFLEKKLEYLISQLEINKSDPEVEYKFSLYSLLLIRYQLRIDQESGIRFYEKYKVLAGKITNGHPYRFLLVNEMLPYIEKLDRITLISIAKDYSEVSLLDLSYEVVVDFVSKIIPVVDTVGDDVVAHLLFLRGNAYLGLGNLANAVIDYQKVIDISRANSLLDLEILSTIKISDINWSIGGLDKSNQGYIAALDYAVRTQNYGMMSSVLEKLALVTALLGYAQSSQYLINRAIQLCQTIENPNSFNESRERLGEVFYSASKVYTFLGLFDQAINYVNLSSDEMNKLGIKNWQSQIRTAKGVLLWLSRDLDGAEKEIQALVNEKLLFANIPATYLTLGNIKWIKGYSEEAERYLSEGLLEASSRGDAYFEILILSSLSGLAFERQVGAFTSWRDFLDYFEKLKEKYPELKYRTAIGALLTNIGHLAVGKNEFSEAKKLYADGLTLLAGMESTALFQNFDIYSQLSFIHNKITRLLGAEKTRELGEDLNELWNTSNLNMSHPEAIMYFTLWSEGNIPKGLG